MVPPATPTPTRRREGGWRESYPTASAPYPYDYEAMSPNPYAVTRGPPPTNSYHYDSQGPLVRGPPGPPPTDYWHPSSPYRNEHQYPPPHASHRGGGGPYWTTPPPIPYDGYRGAPTHPGSLRGAPHGGMHHPPHYHQASSRRSYGGDQQVGHESRIPPTSPGDHRPFHQNHRKDFSPPAPATEAVAVADQVSARGVQVAVSASADSEETPQPNTRSKSIADNSMPLKNEGGSDTDDALMDDGPDSKRVKKEGDPLSVLADVSAGMGGKNKNSNQEKDVTTDAAAPKESDSCGSDPDQTSGNDSNRPPVPMPAPTSPLQRRLKPSPITPSQTPQVSINSNKRTPAMRKHQPITPSRSHDTSSSAEGTSQTLQPNWEPPPLPHGGSSGSGSEELYTSHPDYNSALQPNDAPYNSPARRSRSIMQYGSATDFGPPFPTDSPALVERGSFDSHGDGASYRGGAPLYPPSTPTSSRGGGYFYDDQPPTSGYGGNGSGGGGPYWDSGHPPYSPPYPHQNRGGGGWNQPYPPPTHSDSPYGPHTHHGPPPDYSYPPPPPHFGGREDHDLPMYANNPPPHPPYHHRGPPPPIPGPHHPGMPMHPPHMGGPPYAYSHHTPRMEEKTILRKKFSWKHYPELERFLIANRDEYLKHSNMNYTAEQKQYNNWLTERLLEVASQHNYMFDPDEFNFVAIRDRIRCYYKSYVQTARKRGLKLPEKKSNKSKATVEPKKE